MKQSLLKNTLIVGAGKVSTQFIALFLIPLYTIFLSPSEYGIADLIITYTTLAVPFISLGLEQGAFRFLIENKKNQEKQKFIATYTLKITFMLMAIAALVVIGTGLIGGLTFLYVAVAYAVSAILLNVYLWLARGFSANIAFSVGNIIVGVVQLLSAILMVAALKFGLTGMMLALTFGNIAGIIYVHFKVHIARYISMQASDNALKKDLLKYSVPLIPNSVSWWLVNALDRTIIALFLGVAATGIYAVSVKFPAILVGLFSIFWISWHESASLNIDQKGSDEFFSKVTNAVISLFGSLLLMIVAGVSILFDYIVGPEFSDAYLYIPILMVGALLSSLITFYGSIYAAKKATRQILNTTLIAALVNIVVILSLVHFIGLYAAAIASVIAHLAMFMYRHIDVKKFVTITLDVRRIIVLALAMCVVFALYYINMPQFNLLNLLIAVGFAFIMNKGVLSSAKEMIWKKLRKS